MGSGGVGSTGHLGGELLQMMAGIKLTHVPYRGATQGIMDVVSGRIPVMFSALANHAGTTGGYVSCGGSGVWGPTGDPLCRASSAAETLLVAELDPSQLSAFRNG